MYDGYQSEQLVTLIYLLADPARDELAFGNAGHPPPVLLHGNLAVTQLPFADGPPLGVTLDEPRQRSVIRFPVGDTVVAFTDGLIERRDEDITDGQKRVAAAVRRLSGHPLPAALTALVSNVRDPSRDDDVAVLAVRRRH
jgi:serine phosphatase RsbU (regulator of sigma subunit)